MKVAFLSPDSTEICLTRYDYYDAEEYEPNIGLRDALLDFSKMQKINRSISEVLEKFGNWKVLVSCEEVIGTNWYYSNKFKEPKTIKELCLTNIWMLGD